MQSSSCWMAPPWSIRSCASNLERIFDNCQPSVQALKLVRITLRSEANSRPRALRHRDPTLPIHQPSGVVESPGHHRGGNCEAALYLYLAASSSMKSSPDINCNHENGLYGRHDSRLDLRDLRTVGAVEQLSGRLIRKYCRYLRPIVHLLRFCCDCLIANRFDREMHNEGRGA
jgi:hypothetical protein